MVKYTFSKILILTAAFSIFAADWPVAGGNPMRTNNVEDPGFEPPTRILWRYYTDGTGYMHPIYAKGTVYIGDQEGTVYALNGTTGELRWRRYLECVMGCKSHGMGLFYYQGSVGFISGEYRVCTFHYMDATTGKTKWSVPMGPNENKRFSPVGYKGLIYGSSFKTDLKGSLYWALDTATGNTVWSLQEDSLSNPVPPVIDTAKGILYGSFNDSLGYTFALDLATRTLLWKNTTPVNTRGISLSRDTLYLTTPLHSTIKGGIMTADSGRIITQAVDFMGSGLAVSDRFVVQPFYGGDIWVKDRMGRLLGDTQASIPDIAASSGCGAPLICNGYAIRGGGGRKAGRGGYLAVISIADVTAKNNAGIIRFRSQTGCNICATPCIGDGRVYAFGSDGWLYCYGR